MDTYLENAVNDIQALKEKTESIVLMLADESSVLVNEINETAMSLKQHADNLLKLLEPQTSDSEIEGE